MSLLADGFLILAAAAAAVYCAVLSGRLSRLTGLQGGLGAAIVSLSDRADAMNDALARTKDATESAAAELTARTALADAAANRLERLLELSARDGPAETAPEAIPETDGPTGSNEDDAAIRAAADDPQAPGDGFPPDAANALDVIRKASVAEDDDAFAMRLVDALAALQPERERTT